MVTCNVKCLANKLQLDFICVLVCLGKSKKKNTFLHNISDCFCYHSILSDRQELLIIPRRYNKIGKTELSQASCNCCYIICQSQSNETNFTQWLNSPVSISLCSLLTAPWAMCVCMCCVCVCAHSLCVLRRILFTCSTGPRRRNEAWRSQRHFSAKHRECSASSI